MGERLRAIALRQWAYWSPSPPVCPVSGRSGWTLRGSAGTVIVWVRMPHGDRAHSAAPVGNSKACRNRRLVFELAKEAGAETKRDRSEEHVLDRCTSVDPPIGHRPRISGLSEPGVGLVGIAVPVDIGGRIHGRNQEYWSAQKPRPREGRSARWGQRGIPVLAAVIAGENQYF